MTTMPFEPRPESGDEEIAAADVGRGGPQPAPGFGVAGEEPDQTHDAEQEQAEDKSDAD
ncbi:hypothetical protein ACFS2C_17360 [Prauserella oleivorans]|uniref:Uncharacterized protein n=1 Tax=Prauserella oleivorans TaxID=1478153 RepID=A0ABW5WDB1_9PSEU